MYNRSRWGRTWCLKTLRQETAIQFWNLFQILASRKLYKDIQGTTFFPRVLMTLALVSIKSILPALLHISHNFCALRFITGDSCLTHHCIFCLKVYPSDWIKERRHIWCLFTKLYHKDCLLTYSVRSQDILTLAVPRYSHSTWKKLYISTLLPMKENEREISMSVRLPV